MDRLRIGVIGAGCRGGLAQCWHQPEGESVVVAAADLLPRSLDWAKEHVNKDAVLTANYRDILGRDDIDAVAVLTPDHTHEEIVTSAFKAGKHVFCEKPLHITVDGCDRMLEAWQASGKEFMVGFNMRYMNIFRVMKDIADSGTIGEIKAVWVRHFVQFGGDYFFHDWHSKRENTTGLLLQKASHDIDIIHWITGQYTKKVAAFGGLDYYGGDKPNDLECPTCPDKDQCIERQDDAYLRLDKMKRCAYRKEIDVEDNDVMIMELENGIKATYAQCHFAPDSWRSYTFIGTEGRMENLDMESKVTVKLRGRSERWKNLADQEYAVKPAEGGHIGADPVITRDFVDMVLHGKKPVAPAIAGRMSVAAGFAATESLREGGNLKYVAAVPDSLKHLLK